MINVKKEGKSGRSRQLNLWDQVIQDPVPLVKAAMSEAIRTSSLSREQIVDEMNRAMKALGWTTNGRNQAVTVSLLDKWVAPSAAHVIPLRLLPLFCRTVESTLPLKVYATCFHGVSVISTDDAKLLAWARSELELRQAKKRARRLAQEMGL